MKYKIYDPVVGESTIDVNVIKRTGLDHFFGSLFGMPDDVSPFQAWLETYGPFQKEIIEKARKKYPEYQDPLYQYCRKDMGCPSVDSYFI
jgi:hypothetical protein